MESSLREEKTDTINETDHYALSVSAQGDLRMICYCDPKNVSLPHM